MKFLITHSTRFEYEDTIPLSHNLVRLRPRDHATQVCLKHDLIVLPAPAVKSEGLDYFGNHVSWFSLQEPHSVLRIASQSEVEVSRTAQPSMREGPSWEEVRDLLLTSLDEEIIAARQFSFDSRSITRARELADFASVCFGPGMPLLQCVYDLTQHIYQNFKYLPGSTKVGTPILEVLQSRKGVCQDFAHLEIACLRSLGLAARYVSGYIATYPPPGKARLIGADASHAWLGAFVPGIGWGDFDPTNGIMPSENHATVAWGRDYDDVGPARGILIGGHRHSLDVAVDMVPIETLRTQ